MRYLTRCNANTLSNCVALSIRNCNDVTLNHVLYQQVVFKPIATSHPSSASSLIRISCEQILFSRPGEASVPIYIRRTSSVHPLKGCTVKESRTNVRRTKRGPEGRRGWQKTRVDERRRERNRKNQADSGRKTKKALETEREDEARNEIGGSSKGRRFTDRSCYDRPRAQ